MAAAAQIPVAHFFQQRAVIQVAAETRQHHDVRENSENSRGITQVFLEKLPPHLQKQARFPHHDAVREPLQSSYQNRPAKEVGLQQGAVVEVPDLRRSYTAIMILQ